MIKIGIVYATKTKHSKKLAEAIGGLLNTKAENVSSNPVMKDIDLLFVVGGIYAGESLPELLKYIGLLDGKEIRKVALITSCASKKQKQDQVRSLLTNKGIEVVDEMVCQGSFLFMGIGHPNKADIEQAVSYAKRLVDGLNQR